MTTTVTAITLERDTGRAAEELVGRVREGLGGAAADALVVFASPQHDHVALLAALAEGCGTEVIAGASSAGEFTSGGRGEGSISLLALRAPHMDLSVGVGRHLSEDPAAAARRVAESFRGVGSRPRPYRAALVMTDALAGHADAAVEELTLATGGRYRFFGGGAGDDGRFERTFVFAGREVLDDALVALEILSDRPLGVGVSHGWEPTGPRLRVTEARGSVLVSLNGAPTAQAFEEHARATGQHFDRDDPLAFFLHNVLGIESDGGYRLRVPLKVDEEGSVSCAATIPDGAVVSIMRTTAESAVKAAEQATQSAVAGLGGHRPAAALVFDCVATRLRLGQGFDDELSACATALGGAGFVGCNTYGQIARAEGQFGGFHNCTAVVCVLPE